MDEYETYLMDYLQRFPGQRVKMWEVLNTLGKILITDPEKVASGSTLREEKRRLSTAIAKLIKEGKVRRYQMVNRKRVNLIRLNEAYIVND